MKKIVLAEVLLGTRMVSSWAAEGGEEEDSFVEGRGYGGTKLGQKNRHCGGRRGRTMWESLNFGFRVT